ncbi:MAG: hypothetical protein N4A31_06820 [Rickettsiales bacterium]|jgi:hypothetical protein|nr:hypothetical protein [Rickettsiales bacterium]
MEEQGKKPEEEKSTESDQEILNFLNNNMGGLGIQFGEVPIDHYIPGMEGPVPFEYVRQRLGMQRPLFEAEPFQYRIITPSDGTIEREKLLERIGFSKEAHTKLMQLIIDINQIIINKSDQLAKIALDKVRYSRFIDNLLSEDKIIEIMKKAKDNKTSLLQQLLADSGFQNEEGSSLKEEIKIINYLIDNYIPLVLLQTANITIEGGLSASIGRTDNYEYYAPIILSALLKNIIALEIINPIALALSKASDYLSPAELRELTGDISEGEWQGVKSNISEDIIPFEQLDLLLNVIRGEKLHVITFMLMKIRSLSVNRSALEKYINTCVESVLIMAVKFNRAEIVEFIVNNGLSIIKKDLLTDLAETVFCYDMEKFVSILFSALIRGDHDTCLKFLNSVSWDRYTEHEKVEIVRFIILRSGHETREALLREIFTNKNIVVAGIHLYKNLLKKSKGDEYTELKAVIAPFIAEYIVGYWNSKVTTVKGATINEVLEGTMYSIIEVAEEDQEDIILTKLYEKGLLSIDLFESILNKCVGQEFKEKAKKLFSKYTKIYTLSPQEILNKSDVIKKDFIFSFGKLSDEEKEKFLQEVFQGIKEKLDDNNVDQKKLDFLLGERRKLEWIKKNNLFSKDNKKKANKAIKDITGLEGSLLFGEDDSPFQAYSKGKVDSPSEVLPQRDGVSSKGKKKKNKTKKKKANPDREIEAEDTTPDDSGLKNQALTEQQDKEGDYSLNNQVVIGTEIVGNDWQEVSSKKTKKGGREVEATSGADKPGGAGGGGSIKSPQKRENSKDIKRNSKVKPASKKASPLKSVKQETSLDKPSKVGVNSYKAMLLEEAENKSGEESTKELVSNSAVNTASSEEMKDEQDSGGLNYKKEFEIQDDGKNQDAEFSISSGHTDGSAASCDSVSNISGEYISVPGPDGVHFYYKDLYYNDPQQLPPVVPVVCNACVFNPDDGSVKHFYMDPNGVCIDQWGNQFTGPTGPVYYPYNPNGFYGSANETSTIAHNYGGDDGGGGGAVAKSSPKKNKKGYKGVKKHKVSTEEDSSQGELQEISISLSSLPEVKVVDAEKEEYEDAIKEVQKRLDDNKPHVQLGDFYHFDMKLQNASYYVPISQDEYMMPKLPFSESPVMFFGGEKLNIDQIFI